MKKPTGNTWHDALKQAVEQPEAPGPGEARAPAPGSKVPFASYLPVEYAEELRQLSYRLSLERGHRVAVAELVTEAVAELLAKHRG